MFEIFNKFLGLKIFSFYYLRDVGGQKSLRSYWRNYFETTDGLVWVVDSADKIRMNDCKIELHALLLEEVSILKIKINRKKNI